MRRGRRRVPGLRRLVEPGSWFLPAVTRLCAERWPKRRPPAEGPSVRLRELGLSTTYLRRAGTRPDMTARPADHTVALHPGRSRSRPRGPGRCPHRAHSRGVRQPQHGAPAGGRPSRARGPRAAGGQRRRVRHPQGPPLRHRPRRHRDPPLRRSAAGPGSVQPGVPARRPPGHRGHPPGPGTVLPRRRHHRPRRPSTSRTGGTSGAT